MSITYLDPVGEPETGEGTMSERPENLNGLSIGVLDNGKTKADKFLEILTACLVERHDDLTVEFVTKPSPFKPAPPEIIDDLSSRFGAVITGIGD